MPLLEWKNLKCAFGDHEVFSGFSGTLSGGERVRVVAPSGAGKTSFFNMLLGLETPAEGTILLQGRPLDSIPRAEMRACVGAVLQEPDFGVVGTVRQALLAPFAFKANRSASPTNELLVESLAKVALPPTILDAEIASVSGGERQRLACVVAMLLPRKVLLLDEPFSALDEENARLVANAFSNRTVLYTTHADPVPDFATREVVLA